MWRNALGLQYHNITWFRLISKMRFHIYLSVPSSLLTKKNWSVHAFVCKNTDWRCTPLFLDRSHTFVLNTGHRKIHTYLDCSQKKKIKASVGHTIHHKRKAKALRWCCCRSSLTFFATITLNEIIYSSESWSDYNPIMALLYSSIWLSISLSQSYSKSPLLLFC